MQFIKVTSQRLPHVALLELNRPQQLNAINPELVEELCKSLHALDEDGDVRAIVVTGNEKAFAAGADIKQMADKSASEMLRLGQFDALDKLRYMRTPTIAAVSGFALGGGCELAMLCDIVIASETARFGQPEVKLGIIPGIGGTQRLTHAVGKSKAMELVLTGRFIAAEEARACGLVSHVFPVATYLEKALELGSEIAEASPFAVHVGKEAVNRALETSLEEGLAFERRSFYAMFGSEDQREGMRAFIEKRKARFTGK